MNRYKKKMKKKKNEKKKTPIIDCADDSAAQQTPHRTTSVHIRAYIKFPTGSTAAAECTCTPRAGETRQPTDTPKTGKYGG
jgi:hypothetical protein